MAGNLPSHTSNGRAGALTQCGGVANTNSLSRCLLHQVLSPLIIYRGCLQILTHLEQQVLAGAQFWNGDIVREPRTESLREWWGLCQPWLTPTLPPVSMAAEAGSLVSSASASVWQDSAQIEVDFQVLWQTLSRTMYVKGLASTLGCTWTSVSTYSSIKLTRQ